MKPDQLHHHLIELSEKLGIVVSEQNLKISGIPVKSGFCIVKGQKRFILDKHLTLKKKNKVLASFLIQLPIDHIFVAPKVREFLKKQN